MTDLALPTAIFKRLEDLARAENRTPTEIVEQLLVAYFEEHEAATIGDMTIEDAPPGSLAALAQAAIRAGIRSEHPVDTSSRVNEIMRTEFADYVRRNMNRENAGDENGAASG